MLAEQSSHIFAAELAGAAVHSGLVQRSIESPCGRFTGERARAKLRDWGSFHSPRTALLALEDTQQTPVSAAPCDRLGSWLRPACVRWITTASGSARITRQPGSWQRPWMAQA
jgi:hypothetical protein